MRIPQPLLDEIVAHARKEAPNECCGVLGGSDGEIRSVHRARNVHASPVRFEFDPMELYRITEAIERSGEEGLGYYHSHVRAPAYPSQTDVNWMGKWPEYLQVICSLGDPQTPQVRGFHINGSDIVEAQLEVVQD